MENSRDSSVWRSLAVAFGDGLAFGVGMALSQKARREAPLQTETPAIPEDRVAELERRLAQLEKTPARIDPKVLETIVGAFENDLRARDEEWTRRLQEAVEPAQEAISRQEHADAIHALRQDVVADLRMLEAQANALRQEITEGVPRLVEERVAALVAGRVGEIEDRLKEEARQAAVAAEQVLDVLKAQRDELRHEIAHGIPRQVEERAAAMLAGPVAEVEGRLRKEARQSAVATEQALAALEAQGDELRNEITLGIPRLVEDRVAAVLAERVSEIEERLREEARQSAVLAAEQTVDAQVAERDREIRELREQLAASDRRMIDLLGAIGDACRQAAGTATPPPSSEPEPPKAESNGEGTPQFSTESPHVWSLPLVSSLLVATGCFAAMHWF